jgi:alpha-beta hydrolase superfamily lysophospholipase
MSTEIKTLNFKSTSGLWDINAKCYASENPVGIVQITHGMAEHIERYDKFAKYLSDNGYAVYLHDHIGHGASVENDEKLGYFGEENGQKVFVDDVHELNKIAHSEFPDLPVVLFGHSMGSFVARSYCTKYPDTISAAIFCGTAGPNPAAKIGELIASAIAKAKGSFYRSKFIDKMAFGTYCKKIQNPKTTYDWLTRDATIVDEYIADPYCGFLFTAKGYRDMFRLLQEVSAKDWYAKIPANLPLFLIAGEEDPVGAYGKGVMTVVDELKATGHQVDSKIYPDCRHEILNEINYKKVFADTLDWIKSVTDA